MSAGNVQVLGMLFIVDVRMVLKGSDDITRSRLLVVGGQESDIELKLRWMFDVSKYSEFSIMHVEKVREKVHVLSTVVTQEATPTQVIDRPEGSQPVPSLHMQTEQYRPKLYAVGIVTTMLACDENHALRKVGSAISGRGSIAKSFNAPKLSEDSSVTVEQVALSTGFARPRDVSAESNRAHFVRG